MKRINLMLLALVAAVSLVGCKKPISDLEHVKRYQEQESERMANIAIETVSEISKTPPSQYVVPITAKDVSIMEYHVERLKKAGVDYDPTKVVISQAYRDTLAIQKGQAPSPFPDTSSSISEEELHHKH